MSVPGLIAVVRARRAAEVTDAHLHALLSDEVRAVEIALTGDDPWRLLERACSTLGDEAAVGAGTVLSAEHARRAVAAGARFLASPALPAGIEEAGAVAIPGVCTPDEVLRAAQRGFVHLKLFPARLGPAYLRDLLGPFPGLSILPSGGVDADSLPAWRRAGATGAFLGTSLLYNGNALRAPGDVAALSEYAARRWSDPEDRS